MIPELFRIGSFSISPFGPLLVAAFLAAYLHLRWGFKRLELGDEEDASAIMLAAMVGGIVGAKIYYAALYQSWALLLDRSGLVWYGGLALGAAAVFWTVRRRGLPLASSIDAMAPGLALGYGVGRVGCLLVGDDYGTPTSLPWGMKFPEGLPGPTTAGFLRHEFGLDIPPEVPAAELLAVHPTQLYETLAGIAIWAVGVALLRRRPPAWAVSLTVFGLLGVERFGVEFLRAKDDRFLDGFTVAQLISAGLAVAAAYGLMALRRRRSA